MNNKTITLNYIQLKDNELSSQQSTLVAAAQKALLNAYAPYSKFSVGAAVLLDNGEVVTGSNQENAAYPSGLCAERVALFMAHHLYPSAKVVSISVAAQDKGVPLAQPIVPCSACRQVMSESIKRTGGGFEVILVGADVHFVIPDANDLIPFRFDLELE